MFTSLHRPATTTVRELDNSVIVLTVTDDKGNDSNIFFDNYDLFFNFSKTISKGGIYGINYDLKTGQKVKNQTETPKGVWP